MGKFGGKPKMSGMGLGTPVNDPKAKDGGGDPVVTKEAKKKTIGMISGDTTHTPRMDRPKRACGGSVMAPAAARNPMACAAKGGSAPKKSSGPGY